MNTDQIAAVRKRIIKLTGEMPEYIEAEIDAIIKAAIEKAYEQGREDEYQEWDKAELSHPRSTRGEETSA